MPLPKRRSSSSSSSSRTSAGSDCLPPPTMIGAMNRWHSSTNPALNALAARLGPPTVRSRSADPSLPGLTQDRTPAPSAFSGWTAARGTSIDDLVGRLPDLGEVPHELRLGGQPGVGFPVGHRLVHSAPVEVSADRLLEVVDEPVNLLVRLSPVEVAVLVLDVTIEGGDRCVDQLGHVVDPAYVRARVLCGQVG